MYIIKDYRLKVQMKVKKKEDVIQQVFALACMLECRHEDIRILNEETGIEVPLFEFNE